MYLIDYHIYRYFWWHVNIFKKRENIWVLSRISLGPLERTKLMVKTRTKCISRYIMLSETISVLNFGQCEYWLYFNKCQKNIVVCLSKKDTIIGSFLLKCSKANQIHRKKYWCLWRQISIDFCYLFVDRFFY